MPEVRDYVLMGLQKTHSLLAFFGAMQYFWSWVSLLGHDATCPYQMNSIRVSFMGRQNRNL